MDFIIKVKYTNSSNFCLFCRYIVYYAWVDICTPG